MIGGERHSWFRLPVAPPKPIAPTSVPAPQRCLSLERMCGKWPVTRASQPPYPRTRRHQKLRKRLGVDGCWSLICLFLWAADNKSDGDLRGMSDEDIEIAADWPGDEGVFVRTLREVVFLDGEDGKYHIHDWAQHNPYAMAHGQRVEAAKRAAFARWQPHQYAEGMRSASGAYAEGIFGNWKAGAAGSGECERLFQSAALLRSSRFRDPPF